MPNKLKIDPLQARHVLWTRGDLTWKLHAGQKIINEHFNWITKQLFVANISRQWGKSYWAVTKAIETAIKKPRSRIKYATAFYTDLIEFIIPSFEMVLDDCPLSVKPKFKKQGAKFVFRNGSEIKLIGLDRTPNSLRGNKIDLIILDEAGFIQSLDYVYKNVIIPATTHRPHCKIIMISTPPVSPAHPFVKFIQKSRLENAYVKLDIFSNPLINQGTIDRLMDESGGSLSTTWRREYLCEIVTDSSLAIIGEWKEEYEREVPRDDYYQFYHKYVAMDLGVGDQTAVLYGYYDFIKASLIIENEFVMSGETMTSQRLKSKIIEMEKETFGELKPYLRISDNNNPLLLQDLSIMDGIHFIPTSKGTLEEMINAVKIMVYSGRVIVNPKCKQLIGCLNYGVWNKNRTQFDRLDNYGHFDALAALVYLVRNLNKTTNPIPLTFKVDQSDSMVFNRSNNNISKLRKAFDLCK